jgi:hypothetical protein
MVLDEVFARIGTTPFLAPMDMAEKWFDVYRETAQEAGYTATPDNLGYMTGCFVADPRPRRENRTSTICGVLKPHSRDRLISLPRQHKLDSLKRLSKREILAHL